MQVFILTITRQDGSPFVTSVSDRGSIRPTARRFKAQSGEVSHWRRDGDLEYFPDVGSFRNWELQERFAL